MKQQRLEPIRGEHFQNNGKIYRVDSISKSQNSVRLIMLETGEACLTAFDTFFAGFKQVWKIGEVANFLNRSTRSLYRYEYKGQIEKPKRFVTVGGRELRFYTKQDVLDMHELIGQIHQGRPRKDNRIVNNGLPPKSHLLQMFRERYKI